jgi:hypothetical protein
MDNQEIFTQKAVVKDETQLTWTDNFTFKIETGTEILQIEIVDAIVGPADMADSQG